MGNEQATGYVVLDLRVSETEKDIKAVSDKLESHISKNDDEHKEMRANIAESTLSVREIKLMMAQMVSNTDDMKKNFKEATDEIKADVKSLGDKSEKEKGWRAIVTDILKIIILIIIFIATGKFAL